MLSDLAVMQKGFTQHVVSIEPKRFGRVIFEKSQKISKNGHKIKIFGFSRAYFWSQRNLSILP